MGEVVGVVHGSVPEQLQARGVLKKIPIRKKDKMKWGVLIITVSITRLRRFTSVVKTKCNKETMKLPDS